MVSNFGEIIRQGMNQTRSVDVSRPVGFWDDESAKGLGRVKNVLEERTRTYICRSGRGRQCRPLVPTPFCFQNGGLMLETYIYYKRLTSQKRLDTLITL